MYDNEFSKLISEEFDLIKSKFESKSISLYEEFDEDVFIDAYIKCCEVINKPLSKEECIKYFWTAYANRFKTMQSKNKYTSFHDIQKNQIISINESYNYNIDILYGRIINDAKLVFNSEYVEAWIYHICEGKSYKELEQLGYNFKFNDVFKKIMKWVRKNYNIKELS